MESRSVWNGFALVATLGLCALVAVVAVSRSDLRQEEPSARATTPGAPGASVTATASPSAPPGRPSLAGAGPFVVYALGNEILAFDVAAGKSVSVGRVDGFPAIVASGRQPGRGRLVAFTTGEGTIWTIARRGLERVMTIPASAGSGFTGALLSADDRKVAVATTGPQPTTVVVDLRTKKPTNLKRTRRGEYPDEPLVPAGWGLGGTVLYEIPYCECDSGSTGLFALDTTTAGSAKVAGTSSTRFFELAVAPSGQALYYGTERQSSCPGGSEGDLCPSPPYFLRRLVAGTAGADIIRRRTDYPFRVDAISQDGNMILVHRPISEEEGARLELYSNEGERQPGLEGVPERGGVGLAILPNDVYAIRTTIRNRTAFLVLKRGGAIQFAQEPETGETLSYLGWLR